MNTLIKEYLDCVEVTVSINLLDKKSIKKNNHAVDKMYSIIRNAAKKGNDEINHFFPLLKDPKTSKWLAHQLVEICELPKEIEDQCFSIVYNLAKSNSANEMGEAYWLEEWSKKKGRK